MKLLNDLLISKIRKVTLAALKEDDLKTEMWATKDSDGTWVLVCHTCIMAWQNEDVDSDSTKIDGLIAAGFEGHDFLQRFEDEPWLAAIAPNIGKIVKAEKMPLTTAVGAPFEYLPPGWSRAAVKKKRAYYRPEYIQLAQEIAGPEVNLKFMVYPNGVLDNRERVWLVIYEGKRPFMVVSNVAESVNAEENACPTE